MNKNIAALFVAALLGAALGATGAIGQQIADPSAPAEKEKVCLQPARMWSYDIVDERTLVVTDQSFKRYTVRMASGCVGMTRAEMNVILQARMSLACFGQPGDRVVFINPALGRLSCFVTSVENYVPPAPKDTGQAEESKPAN